MKQLQLATQRRRGGLNWWYAPLSTNLLATVQASPICGGTSQGRHNALMQFVACSGLLRECIRINGRNSNNIWLLVPTHPLIRDFLHHARRTRWLRHQPSGTAEQRNLQKPWRGLVLILASCLPQCSAARGQTQHCSQASAAAMRHS